MEKHSRNSWRNGVRYGVGGLALLAMLVIFATTEGHVSDLGPNETVLQQIGYYVQGAFYAVIVTGFCIAAYVLTRGGE